MDAQLDERKVTILKSDHKDLSGNRRAGGFPDDFQVFGTETQFCHHPQ